MSCTYEYRGHKFNSELELDSFLLEKGKYIDVLGDVVFQNVNTRNDALNTIKTIKEDAKELAILYLKAKKEGKLVYGEDGSTQLVFQSPRVGVTLYLTGLRNSEGKLLFPEFRADDFKENGEDKEGYWSNRFAKWAIGEFTEDEKTLIFKDSEPAAITDPKIQKTYREAIESMWDTQGKIGTQLHSILQLAFTEINSGANKGKYWYELPSQIKSLIMSKYNKSNIDLLTEDHVDQMLNIVLLLATHLKDNFKGPLSFFPEFSVQGDFTNTKNVSANKLSGSIDLLIVDGMGVPHIIDYKTSPKPYGNFNSVKKLAFKYQVGVYERLLRKYGLNTHESTFHIMPLLLMNFDYDIETKKATFGSVEISTGATMADVTSEVKSEVIQNNIDEFLPVLPKFNATSDLLLENVTKTMANWYPNYDKWHYKKDEEIKEELEKLGCFNEENKNDLGLYVYKPKYGKEITGKDPVELFEKVKKAKENLPKRLNEKVSTVKRTLKLGLSKDSELFMTSERPFINDELISSDWFIYHLSKYCTLEWEVVDCEAAEALGLIVVLNKVSGQYDLVKISTNYLHGRVDFSNSKRTGLTGSFEDDIAHQVNTNDLTLEARNGNVELMEAMLALNNLQGLFNNPNYYVGEIAVYNPNTGAGMSATNKELLYNFNRLCKFQAPSEGNNFANGNIKMGTRYQVASSLFKEIMTRSDKNKFKEKFYKFSDLKSCIGLMQDADAATDPQDKIKALTKLLSLLEHSDNLKGKFKHVTLDMSEAQSMEVRLYNQILLALTELQGIDLRQLTADSSKYIETLAIHKKGLSGTYIDNPGYLGNSTLNMITKLVTEAYLNVRLDLVRPRAKLFLLVKNLKKSKGFNESFGNHASLFKGMMKLEDGDLLFVKPEELATSEEREFLEYVLFTINSNRFNLSEELIKKHIANGDKSFYRVPLLKGDIQSRASVDGLLGSFKLYMRKWNPETALEDARAAAEGIFADNDYKKAGYELFRMGTIFDKGEKPAEREEMIAEVLANKNGIGYFEQNLETLCLKHIFAYSMKENTDKVFPMMKAAMIHLTTLGHLLNNDFTETKEFLKEYIVNKVKNESIVNPTFRKANALLGSIKSAASKLTLALVPVQFLYQAIQGIWTDIGLYFQKKEYTSVTGERVFTFLNLKDSFVTVYKDLFRNYNKKGNSICSAINQLYGLNDMDMNTYIDKIKSDQGGVWNITNFLFKFASRPDYYNRLTIFGALMRADGTWKAHSINKVTGELEYNIAEDARFSAFVKGETSNPKYAELKALFIATAKQFMRENAKNADGTLYQMDLTKPNLPRAYTNQQAEAYKALSDNIYGFYSSEKKALLHSTLLGSMWMLMRTYFSGKKNLYLGKGGVKLQGLMVHYKERNPETGEVEPVYYLYDENGNLTDLIGFKPTDAPVLRWEGEWQEGILLTLADCAAWSPKEFWTNIQNKWNHEDERLRDAYRYNFRKVLYDLLMFGVLGPLCAALLGDWLDELKDDAEDSTDVIDGLKISAANIMVKSIQSSFMDFNFFSSIGGPAAQWTPFSIEWTGRLVDTWADGLSDGDIWDALVNTSNASKNFKPFFDTIKPDIFKKETN